MRSVALEFFKAIASDGIEIPLVFGGFDNLNSFSIGSYYFTAVTSSEIPFSVKVVQFIRSELSFHLCVSPQGCAQDTVIGVFIGLLMCHHANGRVPSCQ